MKHVQVLVADDSSKQRDKYLVVLLDSCTDVDGPYDVVKMDAEPMTNSGYASHDKIPTNILVALTSTKKEIGFTDLPVQCQAYLTQYKNKRTSCLN